MDATLPSYFPAVADVLRQLPGIRDLARTLNAPAIDGEPYTVDVRLCVQPGGWDVLHGDPCYDTDHRGFWGAASVAPDDTETDLQATAEDLLSQAADQYWQGQEGDTMRTGDYV